MKYIKYLSIALAAGFAAASCQKHEILFEGTVQVENLAEFQISYFEAIATAGNGIDSIFVNDQLYAKVGGAGQLTVNGTLPNGGAAVSARYFTAPPGANNIRLYRGGSVVYDKNVSLKEGKQNVFVYKLDEDPIILDNLYPYTLNPQKATVSGYDTDSVATIRFINFICDADGNPYPGKLQYQYAVRNTTDWANLGEAVAFGQATARCPIIVHKTGPTGSGFNSSGSQQFTFRVVDEEGTQVGSSDWWTVLIGTVVNHVFRGRIGAEPKDGFTQIGSLR